MIYVVRTQMRRAKSKSKGGLICRYLKGRGRKRKNSVLHAINSHLRVLEAPRKAWRYLTPWSAWVAPALSPLPLTTSETTDLTLPDCKYFHLILLRITSTKSSSYCCTIVFPKFVRRHRNKSVVGTNHLPLQKVHSPIRSNNFITSPRNQQQPCSRSLISALQILLIRPFSQTGIYYESSIDRRPLKSSHRCPKRISLTRWAQ